MTNGECPACGEATKPGRTVLEAERDRLEEELDQVEAKLDCVEEQMDQLEAGPERIGALEPTVALTVSGCAIAEALKRDGSAAFGTAFVGSTCSSCHRTYTRQPSMGHDTRCYGCWNEDQESAWPGSADGKWPGVFDVIFFSAFLLGLGWVVVDWLLRLLGG